MLCNWTLDFSFKAILQRWRQPVRWQWRDRFASLRSAFGKEHPQRLHLLLTSGYLWQLPTVYELGASSSGCSWEQNADRAENTDCTKAPHSSMCVSVCMFCCVVTHFKKSKKLLCLSVSMKSYLCTLYLCMYDTLFLNLPPSLSPAVKLTSYVAT